MNLPESLNALATDRDHRYGAGFVISREAALVFRVEHVLTCHDGVPMNNRVRVTSGNSVRLHEWHALVLSASELRDLVRQCRELGALL